MAQNARYYPPATGAHKAKAPSPLRHASNVSNTSSEASTNSENPFTPSRTSTMSSYASDYQHNVVGLKRSIGEVSPTRKPEDFEPRLPRVQANPFQQAERESLRTLPQAPSPMASNTRSVLEQWRGRERSQDRSTNSENTDVLTTSSSSSTKPQYSLALGRSDSRRAPRHDPSKREFDGTSSTSAQSNVLGTEDFGQLGKSSTGHFRTLAKYSEEASEDDFKINSPEQEVTGMHGRLKLQRSQSGRAKKFAPPGYGGRTWMDQQRQFLQAYEYLCHIGEAKEWIEDIIHKPIPAIVQLEEALRDGVTLAEVVEALRPEKAYRIFRHAKLQFRHSDNIAIFFKFLAEVELPELFRFELVDLYEKKNIPKVIYCIHALSWLLFRKGIVDFRIGNLVGQLEFEQHELEAMQKGLDNANVPMPNFSGVRENFGVAPEPEPEPVETEEQRTDRELAENEAPIIDLQGQVRGVLLRLRLAETMQGLWEEEEWLIDLQSKIRGDVVRQIFEYRQQMRRFAINLQSSTRGFLIRSREKRKETSWKDHEREIIKLQSLVRSRAAKKDTKLVKSQIQQHEAGIRDFQAALRGAICRQRIGDQYHEARDMEPLVSALQANIRGALQRKADTKQRIAAKEAHTEIASFQALARGLHARRQQQSKIKETQAFSTNWVHLQSKLRGLAARTTHKQTQGELQQTRKGTSSLQAIVRGQQQRSAFSYLKAQLSRHEQTALQLQSSIRALQQRQTFKKTLLDLQKTANNVRDLQSIARGAAVRQNVYNLLCELHDEANEACIVQLQAIAKAARLRCIISDQLEQLEAVEDSIVDLQAAARGKMVREQFAEKKRFFKENMQKVIKIQSHVRAKQQGEAYRSLTAGKNPPVSTVKNFVHLLNDSDFDFDEELESEKLQKALVQRVQENEETEQCITELDAKIGLLAHTKIVSDEYAKIKRHYGILASGQLERKSSIRDSFNLKALNKNARAKLERYQELFFTLQTQPQYFARLFKSARLRGATERDMKRLETLVTNTFSFAHKRREEYYLLKLLVRSIREEVQTCSSLQDFIRGNFFFTKLFGSYTRAQKDKKFLRQLLGPLVKTQIMENEQLDLESDPLQIYRAAISDEELRTGRRSERNPDIPREEAIKDPQTRETFIHHLQDLRDIVDYFLSTFSDSANRLPYGTRFIAQQMFEVLYAKFPQEPQEQLLHVVGSWLWKSYFKTALAEPETSGLVDVSMDAQQRRNLGELTKVVSQVALGKLFDKENEFLKPLNSYVQEAISRLDDVWGTVLEVEDAETHFDIGEFNDLYAKVKPTLYIKLTDVFAVHQLVSDDISSLCITQDDNHFKELVRELGNAKHNEAEMSGGSSEVALSLSAKVHQHEDPDADIKSLLMETKRCVLYIIRVQSGANLMEIMVKPVAEYDEDRWEALIKEELSVGSRKRSAYSENNNIIDIASMGYAELKRVALENILLLEKHGRLSRHNHYQDILNEIAIDIRTKHRRRIQRQREIENVRATIAALDEKKAWLDDKLKTYNDTFEQNLTVLQSKNNRKKPLPFTKQFFHERELERLGKIPQYGSYKKSAEDLAKRGILLGWDGYDLRSHDITVSCDKVNVFHIEGSRDRMMVTGASAKFTWDDLLNAEYNEQKVIEFFSGSGDEASSSGKRMGVLRLDAALFRQWLGKKFWKQS